MQKIKHAFGWLHATSHRIKSLRGCNSLCVCVCVFIILKGRARHYYFLSLFRTFSGIAGRRTENGSLIDCMHKIFRKPNANM